jgi:hypothetical protein
MIIAATFNEVFHYSLYRSIFHVCILMQSQYFIVILTFVICGLVTVLINLKILMWRIEDFLKGGVPEKKGGAPPKYMR